MAVGTDGIGPQAGRVHAARETLEAGRLIGIAPRCLLRHLYRSVACPGRLAPLAGTNKYE